MQKREKWLLKPNVGHQRRGAGRVSRSSAEKRLQWPSSPVRGPKAPRPLHADVGRGAYSYGDTEHTTVRLRSRAARISLRLNPLLRQWRLNNGRLLIRPIITRSSQSEFFIIGSKATRVR